MAQVKVKAVGGGYLELTRVGTVTVVVAVGDQMSGALVQWFDAWRESRPKCSLWKLAQDREVYGDKAGLWIAVTPDGQEEVSGVIPMLTREGVIGQVEAQGYELVPIILPAGRAA